MSKASDALTRRDLVGRAGTLALAVCASQHGFAAQSGRFTIGACDWSIGFRGRTEALALAKQLGLDGTESLDLPIKVVRAFRR